MVDGAKGEMSSLDIIKLYWGKKSYAKIGELCSPTKTADAVRKMGRSAGLPPVKINSQNKKMTVEEEVKRDIVLQNLGNEKKQTNSKYQYVAGKLAEAEAMIEAFKSVGDTNSFEIKSDTSATTNEVTAVAVLSDVHFAETVKSQNVNGKNEYNLKIAKARCEKFFISVAKLIAIFSKESKLNNLVLAMLGDLVNGHLRDESLENNSLMPMEEMLAVKEVLVAGINYLLDNTSVNIVCPCHSGNHARTTKELRIDSEHGHSLEYVLYHVLANEFKDNKRVTFIIPTSYHSFVDVGGIKIRFSHGHFMKYMGGVGGIYISVNKAINQWNKVEHADLDVFGHFHQLRDGGNFICNGSVIGWNTYANSIKADFEKPKQAFFLVDHKRKEKTLTAPIFLN